jgi:hypothetical protein
MAEFEWRSRLASPGVELKKHYAECAQNCSDRANLKLPDDTHYLGLL